jgi:hypothetical protein
LRFFVHSELAKEYDIMGMPHPRSCHSSNSHPTIFPLKANWTWSQKWMFDETFNIKP